MNSCQDDNLHLQPPKPKHYKLPPVVQPNWKLSDLILPVNGNPTQLLVQRLCKRYGVRHCLLLDRARSGLYLLRKTCNLKGEWITTSVMHRPTGVLLKQICDSIAFADVDKNFTLSVESASQLISSKTSTIIVTHLFGKCADILQLRKLADQYGLFLIENAVHMAGNMKIGDQHIGSVGDATILSFNVDKPLGAILGGALLTNRDDLWDSLSQQQLGEPDGRETCNRMLKTFLAYRLKPLILKLPGTNKYQHASNGVADIEAFKMKNYQQYTPRSIHPLQAKVAMQCSKREDSYIAIRKQNADRLTELLRDQSSIQLPHSSPNRPHSFTYYPIVFRKHSRYQIGERLAAAGIESKWRYYPLHLQRSFVGIKQTDLSMSKKLWSNHLLIPAGVYTTTEKIEYLANAIKDALHH